MSLCTRGPKTGRANTCQHISSPLPGVTDICGCSTMWLCGAKVFRHNFITFQQLCVTVPSDGVTPGPDRRRNHSYRTSLIFPDVTQAASFFLFVFFWDILLEDEGSLLIYFACLYVCRLTDTANRQDKGADDPTRINCSCWISVCRSLKSVQLSLRDQSTFH